jgi:hypothetical protein
MKTSELVDKYQKVLGGLLGCNPSAISFQVSPTSTSNCGARVWSPVGGLLQPAVDDKPALYQNWGVGRYRVLAAEATVSTFELYQMPHCCGIIVSCRAEVAPTYQRRRVGTLLNTMRQDIGRSLGYSLMLCTDIEQNVPQRRLLKTNGWRDLTSFVNRRTNNKVFIVAINL